MKIEIKNVSKKYGKFEAIKNADVVIEEGTVHGIIGENGSGKTTIIKCLTGIYKPDLGEVLMDSKNVYENPAVKERIGYVADNNEFFPTYRLGKIVKFYREVYKNFSEEKFIRLNEQFNLDMNKRVNELSKGQKMRLAFMINIAIQPEVMILDEPTSGLDAMAKKILFDMLISEVEERGMTVVISSHNLGDLEKICDNVSIIKNGVVSCYKNMEEMMKKARKFQFVFENGAPARFMSNSKLISLHNVGKIYTAIFTDITEEEIEVLRQLDSTYMEEINVNLEEVFVYTNGGEENVRKGIV